MEQFSFFSQAEADALRAQARELYDPERIHDLSGSDIDQEPLTLAKRHIVQAQLGGRITLTQQPLEALQLSGTEGVFIANPPYGERLSDRKSCEPALRGAAPAQGASSRLVPLRHIQPPGL